MGSATAAPMGSATTPMGSATTAPMGSGAKTPPAMGSASAGSAAGMGGMGGMMDGMMAPSSTPGCAGGDCGPAATTPIYPSLMTLPALTPSKRSEIDVLATQQINEGMSRLANGSELLNRATQAGDSAAMQQATGAMREGLAVLDAGIAARRVLSEGKAPRNLAIGWFRREMSLASPPVGEQPRALHGVTLFHLFTMLLLVAFALAMVAMYFFKMRRAASLFGRLEASKASPPPGSAPPLTGSPGSTAPPDAPDGTSPPSSAPPSSGTSGPSALSSAPPDKSSPPASPNTTPVTANWRGHLRVASIVSETPSVKTFRLVSEGGSSMPFTFVPGQFLNVAFSIGGARMNRSYSISSSPTERQHVDLTVRREPRGAVSRHIDDLLVVGDQIETGGPVGRFTFSGTEEDSIVLIAGGVGITPMMSIARYLTDLRWSGDIFLLYGCRAPSDFIFRDQLATLERRNPKLHVTVSMTGAEGTDWRGLRGRLTKELLASAVPDLASRRIQLCGPPQMMEATKAILIELGVVPDQIKTELFGATKPKPVAPGTSAKPSTPATGPQVTFSKNSKAAKIHAGQTVLELSEELGIGIQNSCRVGTCGVCKVKLISGDVTMAVEDSLDADDKLNHIILACQAVPTGDIAVEA